MTDLPGYWPASWTWSLPLIVLTVLAHSFSLFAMANVIKAVVARDGSGRRFTARFVIIISLVVLLVTALHALEALNGMILFELTTAFLFSVIQDVTAARVKEAG